MNRLFGLQCTPTRCTSSPDRNCSNFGLAKYLCILQQPFGNSLKPLNQYVSTGTTPFKTPVSIHNLTITSSTSRDHHHSLLARHPQNLQSSPLFNIETQLINFLPLRTQCEAPFQLRHNSLAFLQLCELLTLSHPKLDPSLHKPRTYQHCYLCTRSTKTQPCQQLVATANLTNPPPNSNVVLHIQLSLRLCSCFVQKWFSPQ
jgi:hypothetical protein